MENSLNKCIYDGSIVLYCFGRGVSSGLSDEKRSLMIAFQPINSTTENSNYPLYENTLVESCSHIADSVSGMLL